MLIRYLITLPTSNQNVSPNLFIYFMDVFCNAVRQTRGLGDGRQALCHPDSSPAQSLVLSIRGCALLDQAQRSPALFAPCTDGKQEDAGKGSLDHGQSSRGGASWEEVPGS